MSNNEKVAHKSKVDLEKVADEIYHKLKVERKPMPEVVSNFQKLLTMYKEMYKFDDQKYRTLKSKVCSIVSENLYTILAKEMERVK